MKIFGKLGLARYRKDRDGEAGVDAGRCAKYAVGSSEAGMSSRCMESTGA
jgi:hypothetical protein